ncbi:MAG: hypothetical protein N2512_07545 [Armatimonadetes bacterium]|nr:hypothetical protein [Armatimonadota bacterium]
MVQLESLDQQTRTRLWNVLWDVCWTPCAGAYRQAVFESQFDPLQRGPAPLWRAQGPWPECKLGVLCKSLWTELWQMPFDRMPADWPTMLSHIRETFYKREWYDVLDLLEFLWHALPDEVSVRLAELCNRVLAEENSAYRVVSGLVEPITSEAEIAQIEQAQACGLSEAQAHIDCALSKLSERRSPDYRNCVKEAISAVEAMCRAICGSPKGTLPEALKAIERGGRVTLHPALKYAFNKLYGYASDEGGIRHALTEDSRPVTVDEAKFFLVACSAFINYLKAKAEQAGIRGT